MFNKYKFNEQKTIRNFLIIILLFLQSCNNIDLSKKISDIENVFTSSMFLYSGRNPEIIQPDDEYYGSACSCGMKDFTGSRMIASKPPGSKKTDSRQLDAYTFSQSIGSYGEGQATKYKKNEVLIKFRAGVNIWQANNVIQAMGFGKSLKSIGGNNKSSLLQKISLSSNMILEKTIQKLNQNQYVKYAQPNYIYHTTTTTPNDYEFNNQWGLYNSGQTVNTDTGTVGYDINACKAWDMVDDCSSVIIAVLDTGVNYNHSDLKNNMWDGTACVTGSGDSLGDCIHGYDFVDNTKDPKDVNGHGTHVAGIIGASGNDGNRISGVCWKSNIMAVRVFDASGNGTTDNIVSGIEFAIENGAKIINASWGDYIYDEAIYDAINEARNNGVLFIAAAGNNGSSNDTQPEYPASYDLDNIISVAAINQNGTLPHWTNYGVTSVDIAAPGVNILSTYPAQKVYAIEYFSSWKRDAGWNYKYIDVNYSSSGITGIMGVLNNPLVFSEYYYLNNMDSYAYRTFDLNAYEPALVTLYFKYACYIQDEADYVNVVYDTDGNKPMNNLGTLGETVDSPVFDLTPISSHKDRKSVV